MDPDSQPDTLLQPGLHAEVQVTVSENDTAAKRGSGLVPVYATPALVALMEHAAVRALEGRLPAGYTSVGGKIDLRHMAATPVLMEVRARAELLEVQGNRLLFHIQAWDELEQIGEASHIRFVVNEAEFMKRVNAKEK